MFRGVLLTFLAAITLASAGLEESATEKLKTVTNVTMQDESTSVEPITTTTTAPDAVPKFVFRDGNVSCVILQANLLIYISYYDGQGMVTRALPIPGSANRIGECGENEETITLQWKPDSSANPFNFTLRLSKVPSIPSSLGGFFVRNITFEYELSDDVFPGTNETGHQSVSYEGNKFETPGAMGYTCTAQQNLTLWETVIIGVSSIHLEAFRNSSSDDFEEPAVDCVDIPESNIIIPVIVGISAAVLIIIAILAFFVVNRRRIQGYQSL